MACAPEVSHDGTRIAFTGMRPHVVPEVWVMNADGGEAQRLTVTPLNPSGFNWSLYPTWHPDDFRIYYASTASGSSQIWGMFANGQGKKQKTGGLGPGYPDANAPELSRDGTRWLRFAIVHPRLRRWVVVAAVIRPLPRMETKTTPARHRLVGVLSACIDACSYDDHHHGHDPQACHGQSAR